MRWTAGTKKPGPEQGQAAGPSGGAPRAGPRLNPWRLAPLLLWGLVALGAIGGLDTLTGGGGAEAVGLPGSSSSATGPGGWAQLYLQAFLPAGEDAQGGLDALYPGAPELMGVQPDSLRAAWTVVLGAQQQAPGYWAVTVAADVQGRSAGHWADLGARYYSVVVAGQAGHYSTPQLPSEVPAPGGATAPELALPAPEGVTGPTAISSTVSQFLQALLGGKGVIARYEVVGLGVHALSPAPFSAAGLTGLSETVAPLVKGSPSTCSALAQVTGTDSAGRTETLSYALSLVLVGGEWEVDQFGGAPALAPAP
jgi:hypothetical protein